MTCHALAFQERMAEHSKYPLALYCSSDIQRNLTFDGKYFHLFAKALHHALYIYLETPRQKSLYPR